MTPEELLRRLQDRLAETRIDALRLSDDQRKKRARIEELLDALDGDDPLETGESLALSAALAGERRVLADAQALARALASAAEDVLYARLDEKAAGLLEFYDARAAHTLDALFQAEPWRELARENAREARGQEARHHARGPGARGSQDHAARRGRVRPSRRSRTPGASEEHSRRAFGALAEWDNFQNVLTLARDILNRQKALRERTQQFATEK